MRRLPSARSVVALVSLVFVWCVLWGEVSVANVTSGLVVSVVVARLGRGPAPVGSVRLRPLLVLVWRVLADLVRSTASVAWEVLTRTDFTEEAIIAVEVPEDARSHLLLLIVTITVTPGTAVVDADEDRGILYLHLLHADRAAGVRTHVAGLAALACRSFPGPTRAEAVGT